MNHLTKALMICALAVLGTPVFAQQPPDPVQSDGLANTAIGTNALLNVNLSEAGCHNTATGENAAYSDTSGSYNTATGFSALYLNTTGGNNTAIGYESLYSNSTGNNNTASGYQALYSNQTGADNVASGYQALMSNTTGINNTAFGTSALNSNTIGRGNAAQGSNALYSNTSGIRNVGVGNSALYSNVSGSYNVALGFAAGNNSTGNDNIYINNQGQAGESQTMRLGTQGSSGVVGSGILSTYVAGVATTTVTGSAVYITASGQLGVLASAERFKTDIKPMGAASGKIDQLRPVTFRLRNDAKGTTQYGLIAEEVAEVYPELAIRGSDGRISGVRYEELAPMLLNELQRQRAREQEQQSTLQQQQAEIADLKAQMAQLNEFKRSVLTALGDARAREVLLAQRSAP